MIDELVTFDIILFSHYDKMKEVDPVF